jgi:peptidoglycan/xylan/chitin deacetylase (PgdA/CDA1 family)
VSGAPIFVYHDVVDGPEALARIAPAHRPYVLTRAQLGAHLDALAAVTVETPGGAVRPRASTVGDLLDAPAAGRFVLSFDDGHESGYSTILPLLVDRGWRATFFVVAGWVGGRETLTWAQLRAMADAGMEIGSHSLTHPFMHELSPADVRREFGDSKRMLEDGLGRAVTVASLPRGSAAPGTGDIIAELGYRAFCTSEPGLVSRATDPFDAPRIAIKWRTSAAFVTHVLAGRRLTLATLRSSYAVKRLGKRLVGAERWRRVRGAMVAGTTRAGL